jgi:hypothetical protein
VEYIQIAITCIVTIASMMCVFLLIDIQSKRILTTQPKGRLIARKLANNVIILSENKEKEFNNKLKLAKVNLNAREFYLRAIMMSIVYGILVYFLSKMFMPIIIGTLLTIITMAFAIYYPFSRVKTRLRNAELRKSIDLPRYLKILTTLLRTQTPYDAVRESIKYAPAIILPYAENLLIEITQYPKSSIPYDNFAKNLGLKQARQFMNLLYQSLDISQKRSREFIEKLNLMADELENESAKKLALLQAKSMQKYNYIMLTCLTALPLAFGLVTMMRVLTKLG